MHCCYLTVVNIWQHCYVTYESELGCSQQSCILIHLFFLWNFSYHSAGFFGVFPGLIKFSLRSTALCDLSLSQRIPPSLLETSSNEATHCHFTCRSLRAPVSWAEHLPHNFACQWRCSLQQWLIPYLKYTTVCPVTVRTSVSLMLSSLVPVVFWLWRAQRVDHIETYCCVHTCSHLNSSGVFILLIKFQVHSPRQRRQL